MEVYAFVGKSGTGKSYNAQKVAKKYENVSTRQVLQINEH